MDVKELRKELKKYLKDANEAWTELESAAQEAEETSDYNDYDQACYDTWEYMAERGGSLAEAVKQFLEGMDK